jgi:hypothetical protein
VWFRAAPEAALERLPDKPEPANGYLFAFRLANGMTKVGYGTNPRAKLRAALNDAKANPERAVTECLFSVPHQAPWKTEFSIHNLLAPLREFGDFFNTDLESVAEILNGQLLPGTGDVAAPQGPVKPSE